MTQAATSPLQTARAITSDIKLAHSVFALPFALLAAFMAALGPTRGTWFVSSGENSEPEWTRHLLLHPDYSRAFWSEFLGQLVLIILAMIFARTVAMIANRLIDHDLDKANPRTAGRAIPSGRLPARTAFLAIVVCGMAFLGVCAAFGMLYGNWWPLTLGPFVLIWISAYGFLKRFTALCHIYLGSSLALSPIAAAIAISPETILPWSSVFQPALWLLAGMVLCWVAGFDIIYALQDVEIDRRDRLHSLPARLGIPGAMWVSRSLHACAVLCLIAALAIDQRLGSLFTIGIGIVVLLLLYEHLTVARWGTTRIALAFFTLNGFISCVLGALGIVDVVSA